jgi:tetratricopeptide (TPR) repeat protein
MNEKIQVLEEQLKQLNANPATAAPSKIKALIDLAWALRYIDPARSSELGRQAEALLEKHPLPAEHARCQAILAKAAVRQGDYQQGLLLGNAAIQLAEDLALNDLLPYAWATLGGAHWLLGNLAEALQHFQQQFRTAQQINDKNIEAGALNNMGLVYDESGNYDQAGEIYLQALKVHETLQDIRGQALVQNNLAMNLYLKGNHSSALPRALQALELVQTTENRALELSTLDTIGMIYTKLLDYSQALTYFQQCHDLAEKMNAKSDWNKSLFQIGRLYSLQGDDDAALPYLHQALQGLQQIEKKKELFECHQLLSVIYERKGEPVQALHHYKQFHTIKEQIFNEAVDKKLKNLQISHEVEALKREAEIHRLKNIELQAALEKVKQLSGLLPICAHCKKIRDDTGYWQDVAVYVREHSEAEFSHGMCPDCRKEMYAEIAKRRTEKGGR